jgi:hypothetical protein
MKPTLTLCLLLTVSLWGQDKKPDFSGRWSLNTAKTDYGRMAKPKTYVKVIDQKEPSLIVTTTIEDQRGESKSFLKMTTDDRDCINEVNGNEFHSKSHWEGPKLVTTVTGDRGLSLVEVRSLSADGKTQTVETYMGQQRSGTPAMVRVEDRR